MHSLLAERLQALGWQQTAQQLDELVESASANTLSYFDFLDTVVKQEWDNRESEALDKRIKKAKFPYMKTIHEFNFSFQPSISEQRVKETCTCRFIANGENRMILGPPGVGKTHLAIGFGLEALAKGYHVLFMTADELGEQCQKALQKGTLPYLMKRLCKPDLIILDEVGYFDFDEVTANVFFQIVSKRYEKGAIIITSNKSYLEWGKTFGDDVLATAILDRLLHHSVTFSIKGDSYRMEEKKKAGVFPLPSSDELKSEEF